MIPKVAVTPYPSRRASLWVLAAIALLAAVAGSGPLPLAAADTDLIAYTMVDQWPEREEAAEGIFQSPTDLDVASDGRVFIADPGAGGVHTLQSSGEFAAPFGEAGGYPQQLGAVGKVAIGPVPGQDGAERVYVLDTATERVVVYALDGAFLEAWSDVNGAGVAASSDGRVYVLDRASSQVAVLSAATGARRFAFGNRGTEDGSFSNFTDVSVSADGRIVAVGDKNGSRVQLFDLATDEALAAADPPAPATLRKVYDLLAARYNKGDNTCRGYRVNALGEDAVFVGEGETACLIDGTSVTYAIAASANSGTICRATVRMPALRADTEQYYALATYDPNSGACGNKRTDLATSPVVVRYDDEDLRSVRTVRTAQSNDGRSSPLLFGPERLSMPAPDVVFVQDRSQLLRFYSTAGEQLAVAARDSVTGDESTETTFMMLSAAEGSETLGEVYGAYVQMRRSAGDGPPIPGPGGPGGPGRPLAEGLGGATRVPNAAPAQAAPSQGQFESGIGRFRTVRRIVQGQTIDVLEPIWKVAATGATGQRGRLRIQMPAIAFNPATQELLVVRTESIAAQRSTNVIVARYAADGTVLSSWDVPDDGNVNPYADLAVGPDGRVYLLDDFDDVVRVFDADGDQVFDVAVAFDARAVAGGPAGQSGSVFVLREAGAIERYDDGGRVTARLDGRPMAYSDPTTLTDLVVDGAGRVYVSDGQSSLISVFEPTADPNALPVPDDGTCMFVGRKTAEPATILLGESTTVSLGIDGACAVSEDPADIVVVAPYFRELQQGVDPSAGSLSNLLRIASRVNFAKHRVGLVTYYTGYTVDLPLTHDAAAYSDAARAVQRFDPPNQDVKARLVNAMSAAADLFDDAPGRRKVMVLLDAQYCDPANERFAGQCAGYPPAEETAAEIRASGIAILVVQGFAASNLASSDEDSVRDVASAHRRMVDYRLPEALAVRLELTDELPANMSLQTDTVSGGGLWAAPTLTWSDHDLAFEPVRHGFDVVPAEAGSWPTNVEARASIVDGWGAQHEIVFEVPQVDVIGPTATPARPTATPVPTTAMPTPEPTREAVQHTVYVPWLGNRACDSAKERLDLVIALDVSNSMQGAKLQAARSAVAALLDAASPAPDGIRVALITFAGTATVEANLTPDRRHLAAVLYGTHNRAGTRVDRALEAAVAEALGSASRPRAGKAVVIVSDGGQTELPEEAVRAARSAESRGVHVFALAVGDDADPAWLASAAGDPDHVWRADERFAPTSVLSEIRRAVGGCP